MPKGKSKEEEFDPTLELKTLALRDEPLVHQYRDLHYQLVLDQLQATGQRIASREHTTPLSAAQRRSLLKRHARLDKQICEKYRISGFHGGDPYIVKRDNWLETLRVPLSQPLTIETNWQSSFYSPRVQFYVLPKDAAVFHSHSRIVCQLPSLPKKVPADSLPILTIHLDLSKVKGNHLAGLATKFKEAVKRCLEELPRSRRKPASTWQQNVKRDYHRFYLHFYRAVPYRWIAAYEKTGALPKGPFDMAVPKESSIRESVERVHYIVFSRPFKARKTLSHRANTRLDAEIQSFNCPDHGKDCSDTCGYAKDFIKKLG